MRRRGKEIIDFMDFFLSPFLIRTSLAENPCIFGKNKEKIFVFPCKESGDMVNYKSCKTKTQFSDAPTIT